MLNLKKVIALVCVFAMMLTTVAFGATYSDVAEESAYYEAVETLNKLDIVTGYEDGTFKPEDGVTRAEMAALIARIQGYGETAKASANTGFTDVPASHWASGYIANAAGMGIINGYGDGTFGPEDPVLYEQAVKMVMATLGYTPFAEKNGGYPTGYLAAAQRYDVSLAVANAAVGQAANRGTVAQILANAIDTPLMVQSKWNTNGEVEYVIADGKSVGVDYKTLMSENLGYVKIRGILEANSVSDITAAKTIDTTADKKVEINVVDNYQTNNNDFLRTRPTEFLVADTDAEDYIGRSVIGYVKKVDNKWALISIAVDTNRNDEIVVPVDQFSTATTGSADTTVKYYKNGANTATDLKVSNSVAIVLNGVYQPVTSNAGATLTNVLANATKFGGAITFIDNDDTKGYDVAFIDLASTGVVKKVTSDGINFHNNVTWYNNASTKEIEVDTEDETKSVTFTKDGAEISFKDLKEWDVLSIYAVNEDANYIVADVVTDSEVGTIASRKASTSSEGGYAYKIADAWYDVATGAYGRADLGVGEGGTFYIDQFGKIAAFVEDSALAGGSTANYAYIKGVDCAKASFGATGCDVKVQMVTADGVKVANLKSNARLEYAANTKVDLDLSTWTDANDDGTPETGSADWATLTAMNNTVVQYVANSNGQITKLTNSAFDTDKFKTASTFSTGAANKYDADNNKFTGGYVDSDAIVFIIDTDAANCKVGSLADLDDDNTYNVTLAYADKKAEDTNIIVVTYTSIQTSTTSNIAVIKEAGESTNENGENIWTLTYLLNGEEVTADTTSDVTSSNTLPTEGDIVKVKVGSEGTITNLSYIWDFVAGTSTTPAIRDNALATTTNALATARFTNTASEKFYGGYVAAYKESSTEATIGGQTIKLSRAANVYVVDVNGKNTVIKNGSDGNFKFFEKIYDNANDNKIDIWQDGAKVLNNLTAANAQKYADHVYVRMYDGKPTDVVIVKGADMKVEINAD